MKVPLNWLKQYVDIDVTAEELQQLMNLKGLEISSIDEQAADIINVVAGRIVSIEPHPNADKLRVAVADVGKERLQIVTGASNVQAGDTVPVALCGAKLPNGMEITEQIMRGVPSYGMLCSGEELRLKNEDCPGAEEHGILLLQGAYEPGLDIREALGMNDTILTTEPTANRPDLLSMIGMAREVGAALGKTVRIPDPVVTECPQRISSCASVDVRDGDLCPRYIARTVQDIHIQPSPKWMRDRLRAAGMRPINNIVDITNYVMLETGQPMHAFDLACVSGGGIIVRRSLPGEVITTLDGKQRAMPDNTLVIADKNGGVGIAGIMGGQNSEITPQTKTVLFESAKFDGPNIRVCAKAMGMVTEASMRFAKGIDIETTHYAVQRAMQLVHELGAGRVQGDMIDVCKGELARKTITASPDNVNGILALNVAAEEMRDILNGLCIPTALKDGALHIEIPHFRDDMQGEADVAEEIGRMVGYDKIPLTLMRGDLHRGGLTARQKTTDNIRAALVGMGAYEAVTFSFTGSFAYDKLLLPEGHPLRNSVRIVNPFGEDNSLMRTTLLTGMLPVLATNLNRKLNAARFFEIGNVHTAAANENEIPQETNMLCIGCYGKDEDFYTLKGMVEHLASSLFINGATYEPGGPCYLHPGRRAVVKIGGVEAGYLGELHPACRESFDLGVRAYVAELNVDALHNGIGREKKFALLPRFPAVERDLSMIVPTDAMNSDIVTAAREASPALLADIRLFDTFTGGAVPQGSKSLAYSLLFRAADRTLTDAEVNEAVTRILSALEVKCGAKLRDQ